MSMGKNLELKKNKFAVSTGLYNFNIYAHMYIFEISSKSIKTRF